jgi:hypothetical protein
MNVAGSSDVDHAHDAARGNIEKRPTAVPGLTAASV